MKKVFTTIEVVMVLLLLSAISGLVLLNNNAIINFAQFRMIKQMNMTKTIYAVFGDLTHLNNILAIEPVKTGSTVYLYYYNTKTQEVAYTNTKYITDITISPEFITATIDTHLLEGLPLCIDSHGKAVECFGKQTGTASVNKLTIRRFVTSYPVVQLVDKNKVVFTAPFDKIWNQFTQSWESCTTPVQTEVINDNPKFPESAKATLQGADTIEIKTNTGSITACKSITVSSEISPPYYFILPAVSYETATTGAVVVRME